jgi:hypothetical protein
MKKDQNILEKKETKEVSSPYHFYLFVRRVEKKMAIDSIILNTGHSNETNTNNDKSRICCISMRGSF